MSNLLASLRSSSSALDALEQSVSVSQNNVMNASTPGYVRQRMGLKSLDFLPDAGLFGGVSAAGIQGARDQYAEQAVRSQVTLQGAANQSVASLSALENAFPINTASGIPAALNRMFQSFTAWSVAPNSTAAKQNVIAAAETVAQSFQQVATALSKATTDADRDLRGTIDHINNLGEKLSAYNLQRRQQQGVDAGLDAQIHETLEQLSELVDFQALNQEDGTISILIGGQVSLVVGEKSYALEARFEHAVDPPANAGAVPAARIYDSAGREVTTLTRGGKLGSLLEFRNTTLPHFQGDGQQEGELNRLAKKIADRVNEILSGGYPPPHN
ncbi:MAG: flagellar hook-associated protein FlgK, partial [Bryobacteraceae bacterium]